MAALARPLAQALAFSCVTFMLTGVASAQAPASAAFPPAAADAPAPPATQPAPPAAPPPATAAPAYPVPAYPAQSTPVYPAAPPAAQYPQEPAPPPPQPGYGYGYGYGYAPPPPPQRPDEGFQIPEFSVRIDPFNWLLEGRLGLELETQVYKFVSVELVPVFVTTSSPPTLNYDSYSSKLTQSSHGLGAISGIGVDAAFWFDGKPFRGYALRTGFTNYSYAYKSTDNGTPVDSVNHTDREFFVMLADASRWGAFTIGGGIGLGYELNQTNRCVIPGCPNDQLQIQLDNSGTVANLNGFLYPFDLLARFSLGVVF